MKKGIFSWHRNVKHAFAGIGYNIRRERSFIIQLFFGLSVILAGILFHILKSEWIIIILTVALVLSLEALNTAIEKVCDRFLSENDTLVKNIKDSAAAAVLIISIASVIIGLLIFLPYVLRLFKD